MYLDSDIIITGSLKELFSININNYYTLVIKDPYIIYIKNIKN
ncbi:glycosyltransferase [Brachyspira catarrhinii]